MFRTKIAILSVTISGAVVFIFGLFFLNVIYQVGIDRIDRELLALGETQLHARHPRQYWQNFDQSLQSIFGRSRFKDLVVEVTDLDHNILYRSEGWPEVISSSLFPDFDHAMAVGMRPRPQPPPREGDNFHSGRPPVPNTLIRPARIKEPAWVSRVRFKIWNYSVV